MEVTHIFEGVEYFETDIVTLKGKEYQELKSVDYMKPRTIYAEKKDGKLEPIKDWATAYALRVKYAMCVLTLHGHLILDNTLTLGEEEFVVENGKLAILNEQKRAIFEQYVRH